MNVGVIGLGKLGLPLLALLADAGHKTIGYDASKELIEFLNQGKFEYSEPDLNELLRNNSGNLEFVDEIKKVVEHSQLIFVIVPTPSEQNGYFSNYAILSICDSIGKLLKQKPKHLTINIVSTVMPGSCEGEISKVLEDSSGMKIGKELGLCYNPEFIALGSVVQNMRFPDMQLLGACNDHHADLVEEVISSMTSRSVPVRRMTLTEAELVKIAVNNYVTMKISFANMLGQLANGIGKLNIDTITEAIGLDSRIGPKYLKYGPPYGGPCFPRDTHALSALLKQYGIPDSLPDTVTKINDDHLKRIVTDIVLESEHKRVGILGLSYKPHTPVLEESPGLAILEELRKTNQNVIGWDPDLSLLRDSNLPIAENFREFLQKIDICVITRPIPELSHEETTLISNIENVIDLWRIIKL